MVATAAQIILSENNMKKLTVLLLLLSLLLSLLACSGGETPTEDAIPIDSVEWCLIYGKGKADAYPSVRGVSDAACFVSADTPVVEMTLTAKDGILSLTNDATGETVATGTYAPNLDADAIADYDITLGDLSGYISLTDTALRDWQTALTGFDGTTYGTHAVDLSLGNDYEMMFISKNHS